MNGRVLFAVLVAVVVFAVYSWFTTVDTFIPRSTIFAAAPVIEAPAPVPSKETVAGPSAPSQRPPKESVVMPEEEARDPSDQGYESAEMPERLRHPERAFAPGLDNHGDAGEDAGLSGQANDVTLRSFKSFGPEKVQNGGSFLDSGVMANDTTLPTGYSEV
jgi:hypothetical protein